VRHKERLKLRTLGYVPYAQILTDMPGDTVYEGDNGDHP
jgi:hypothetical protein